MKESRAPALVNPSVSVWPSTPRTWAFWVRCIQATRRRDLGRLDDVGPQAAYVDQA